MRSLEERLRLVGEIFTRKTSKSYVAAMDVVMKGDKLSKGERAAICAKTGLKEKSLEAVLTKLRKAGLYGIKFIEPQEPPQKTIEIPRESPKKYEEPPQEAEGVPKHPQGEVEESEEKYVTIEHFNHFVEELKAAMGLNPVEDIAGMENPGYEEEYDAPPAESVELEKASMKQMGAWIEAKNLIWFDFARNGAFGGALEDFDGNWSDFLNIVLDDYFNRLGIGIGMIGRRLAP